MVVDLRYDARVVIKPDDLLHVSSTILDSDMGGSDGGARFCQRGEPICEGPLIVDVDDSDPPQCDKPTSTSRHGRPNALRDRPDDLDRSRSTDRSNRQAQPSLTPIEHHGVFDDTSRRYRPARLFETVESWPCAICGSAPCCSLPDSYGPGVDLDQSQSGTPQQPSSGRRGGSDDHSPRCGSGYSSANTSRPGRDGARNRHGATITPAQTDPVGVGSLDQLNPASYRPTAEG